MYSSFNSALKQTNNASSAPHDKKMYSDNGACIPAGMLFALILK